jgi:hypothetical protein
VVGIVALLALGFLMTGCSGVQEISAVEPTPTVFAQPTDIPPPPPGPTPAAFDFPLPASTQIDEESPASDQSCVDCHTNEEMLKAVAEEEVGDQEALSEGEG